MRFRFDAGYVRNKNTCVVCFGAALDLKAALICNSFDSELQITTEGVIA